MFRLLRLALGLAVGFGGALASEAAAGGPPAMDARVYYFGFEVQRMTGIPETQIESEGCIYNGSSARLRQLLSTAAPSPARYEPGDVRAKVLTDQGVWYVDASGVAKVGEKTVMIDKTAFVQLLSLEHAIPCPRRH